MTWHLKQGDNQDLIATVQGPVQSNPFAYAVNPHTCFIFGLQSFCVQESDLLASQMWLPALPNPLQWLLMALEKQPTGSFLTASLSLSCPAASPLFWPCFTAHCSWNAPTSWPLRTSSFRIWLMWHFFELPSLHPLSKSNLSSDETRIES